MLLGGTRLLLMVVVALAFIMIVESRNNLTNHGNITPLNVNSTLNTPENYVYPSNDLPRKSKQETKSHIIKTVDLNNYDVEFDRSTVTSKHDHHVHKKEHRHSHHHAKKTHKNKHRVHELTQRPQLTKKHRSTEEAPAEYGPKVAGQDWSCGVGLNLRCCQVVKDGAAVKSDFPPVTGTAYCRCRCLEKLLKWTESKRTVAEEAFPLDTADNGDYVYCYDKHRGWATPALDLTKKKKPRRM